MRDHFPPDDELEAFEQLAGSQLRRELNRVPLPEGRLAGRRTARRVGAPRQRLAAVPVVLAALLFVAALISAGLRPRSESAAQATPGPADDPAAGQPADWLYMASAPYDTANGLRTGHISAGPLAGGSPSYVIGRGADAILSPDGSVLYGLSSRTLCAYKAATGELLWEISVSDVLAYEGSGPPTLAVSPDGRTLAFASMSVDKGAGETRYWVQTVDLATRELRATMAPGRVWVNPIKPGGEPMQPMPDVIRISPGAATLTTTQSYRDFEPTDGGQFSTDPILSYEFTAAGQPAYQPQGLGALLFSADSRQLYSVAPDAIYAYDLKNGAPVRRIGGPGFDGAAALAPDGRTLYATSTAVHGGNKLLVLHVIDLESGAMRDFRLGVLDDGFNPGHLLAASGDGRRLVVGVRRRDSADQPWAAMLKVLDATDNFAELRRIHAGVDLRANLLAIDSAGAEAYAVVEGPSGAGNLLAGYNLDTGEILPLREYPHTDITRLLIAPAPAAEPAAALHVTPPVELPPATALPPLPAADGTAFVLHRPVYADGARLTALDLASGRQRFAVAGGLDAALAPGGRSVYLISEREIWALATDTGEERWRSPISGVILSKDGGPPVMAVSPDGLTIYVLSYDISKAYWIQFVDARSGAVLPDTLPLGVLDGVPRLGATPDGKALYAAIGGKLRFFDLATRAIDEEIGFDFGSDILPSRDGRRLYVIGHHFPAMEITEVDAASREILRTLLVPAVNGRSTFYNQLGLAGDGRLALGILNSETKRQQLIAVDLAHPGQAALAEATADGVELRRFIQAASGDGRSLYLAARAGGDEAGDALVRYDMLSGAGPFERWPFPGEQIGRVLISPAARPATERPPANAPPAPSELIEIPATATPRP